MKLIFLYYLAFSILSFIFIYIGASKKYNHSKKKKIYKETIGTVIGLREKKGYRGSKYYYSTIRYEIDKQEYIFEYYSIVKLKLETQVEIIYNPNKPEEVIKKKDNTYMRYMLIGIIFFILALNLNVISNITYIL